MPTPPKTTRREALRLGGGLAAVLFTAPASFGARTRSPNELLDVGVVGVGGRGAGNLHGVGGENVVALCDVDANRLAAAGELFPAARRFADYRRMLDALDLDGVVISTPDHTHAVATMAAMRAGSHVYCEKPLTHSVVEARAVTAAARELGRVSQMGTQIHASANYRRVVELVQSGAIGPVREAHSWVGKTWSGGERPADTPPVPEHLSWDVWLGPAPERPYHPAYVPAGWRRFWEFGGGTLGDMACHHMDLPFWALALRYPTRVEAQGPELHPETTPPWIQVRYDFPERETPAGKMPPVTFTWHDGGKRPPQFEEEGKLPQWGDGTLFVGEKGMLLADYGRHVLLPADAFVDFEPPAPTIPDSIGHHREWIEACKGVGTPLCSFDYAGPLSEAVLLGNVAFRAGVPIDWDAEGFAIPNAPEAVQYLHRPYRDGWSL